MRRPFTPRFAAYVAAIFVLLGLVQLVGSLLFYQAIDRQSLSDDHARRVAELLVVSDRVHAIDPALTAFTMSTRHLAADVAPAPAVRAPARIATLERIAHRIVEWEPSLANRSLRLATRHAADGKQDLVGSIRLANGTWLNFRSRDISSMWPVALRATVLTLGTTIILIGIGLAALHILARPLRRLTDAAEAIGQGRRVAISEGGSNDLRNLAHAMNVMQDRIERLLQDQARSFEAISHDLRTPLSRQKIAAELIGDEELAQIVLSSVEEMEALLASLQRFLRAQHLTASAETIELNPFVREVLAPFGDRARLIEGKEGRVRTFPEPLSLALAALVENAIQFGDEARVTIHGGKAGWTIAVADAGPGIPPRYFDAVLDPFFRLDEARARDTKGFGLGIPTAHRLMMRFNGHLSFANAGDGSLIACLRVPETVEA
ncbi:ATP-binding protein [Novosphingobium album (ex Liu et al. 2023)]|uniref:histidine kinase n=1 Tax=Novosphingobium album (ex Liu et al. 2023) TaxID=3031130 RepID=A0ABT5WK73_9SPHN|nr:ATP-binding protein [Novosphingobium album (ex Liu et al. 2023)]MDE8650435.1 ATP-binding protein [Novosphingobium album (ex Liu et al. 2023)]